ncbi:MAG: lipoyl synthase [Candidatus Omnitrophica bacterium]|nr:lipoyl synthase [Candidatus Omnitrophota bacterium]
MQNRLPLWFRQELPDKATLEKVQRLKALKINTVCQEALCPNLSSCFNKDKLTFMILGNSCTRACRFCAVDKANNKSPALDQDEPRRIAETVRELGLSYVVITSVTRDDLADGGAQIFAATISLIHRLKRRIRIEVLIPDFGGSIYSLNCVLGASPDVVSHNIETVSTLYAGLRPNSDYQLSLEVLSAIKKIRPATITKSSMMLGFGESQKEVIGAMRDLKQSRCDILTLGQYLAPSKEHYPVKNFISEEKFTRYKEIAFTLGFKAVLSGPLVRSSYQAEEVYREVAYA